MFKSAQCMEFVKSGFLDTRLQTLRSVIMSKDQKTKEHESLFPNQ